MRQVLEDILKTAISRLMLEEWELATLGVGERTVTSHLFAMLTSEPRFGGSLSFDHEYNRHEGATKTIKNRFYGDELDPDGDRRIYPDIVLHRRGNDDENLLVIEAKKGASCDDDDRAKIMALVEDYDYQYGVLLAFGISSDGWAPHWTWLDAESEPETEPVFDPELLAQLNQEGLAASIERGWVAPVEW